jgi:CRP/FNR family transcriptional regulator, cyclic AMP receptor protein
MDPKSFERLAIESHKTIGERGDNAYLIVSGHVEIRKSIGKGEHQVVAVLGPRDVVGEMALFDQRPRMAEAVTQEDTEVIIVARDEFLKRLNEMNPVMRRMLQIMVGRVRSMTDEFMKRKGESRWDQKSGGSAPSS